MKYWLIFFIAFVSTGCAALNTQEDKSGSNKYPDLGVAPEIAGDVWLNTDNPLRLADLQGKVVLVDMWTFS
jgi:hypothetical protein